MSVRWPGMIYKNSVGRRNTHPLPHLIAHAASVAALAGVMFWFNRGNLLGYIDGQYFLTLIESQKDFAPSGLGYSTNPLQGLNDPWFALNTRWLPEFFVGSFFSNVNLQRTAIFTTAAVELFAVTTLLALWLGTTLYRALAAGWFAVLAIMPLSYPSLFYNVVPDGPHLVSLATMAICIVPLWAGIGRGPWWQDALRAATIVFIPWIIATSVGIFLALVLPFIAVFGSAFLVAAWPRQQEFRRKLLWAAIVVLFLVASGLPQAVLGITSNSAFHFFPDQAFRPVHTLDEGSLLLRPQEPVALSIVILGVIGAFVTTITGTGRMRCFAAATCVLVALIVADAFFYAYFGQPGAIPLYYEYVLWPIYVMFAGLLAASIAASVLSRLSNRPPAASVFRHSRRMLAAVPTTIALVFAGLLVLQGPNLSRGVTNSRPNIYPPTPSIITDYLKEELGLEPGGPFRGRVVTMTGQHLPRGASWNDMFALDMNLIQAVGNDHRTIGMWYYGIPTLVEFSHTLPPLLYAVVTRYLAPSGDVQQRSIMSIRQPNLRILRFLGVRYIVTDGPTTPGTQRVKEMPLRDGKTHLALDQIPHVDVGWSPVETVAQVPFNIALDWLGDEQVDLSRTAMLAGREPGPLTRAERISISIEPGGIRVRAISSGKSLIVVPFAFSNCLQISSIKPRDVAFAPELRRADLLLTGVLFDHELDALIEYRQSPFRNASCSLKNVADIEAGGGLVVSRP
jgi:hypothetical protein